MNFIDNILKAYQNYSSYVLREITFQVEPWYVNYFWYLILLSIVVWGLEYLFPWRKNQSIIRKDFWLDTFYMFFNFFLFNIIVFAALKTLTSDLFVSVIGNVAIISIFDASSWPNWLQFLVFFIALDFVQWITHVLLHRFEFLWKFHKVHHSVEEMGFAAHLRYHWMENVFYTPMKYMMVLFIGNFNPTNVFLIYYISIAIGHLNHANIGLDYGPFKYIFNNPKMHIWHHVYDLPKGRARGINFGISLSIWDYIFGTAEIPYDGRDIKLGFPDMESFPKDFVGQGKYGF